jgi:hypothetical protein
VSYYLDHFLPAHRFWLASTPGDELFSTSSVAFALSLGRNSIRRVPVLPALEHKGQRFYRKKDITAWLEREIEDRQGLYWALRAEHKAELEKRYGRRRGC